MDKYAELVSKGPAAYIKALSDIGWFEQPQNDIKEIATKLLRYQDNIHFVLALSQLSFDAEGFESGAEYAAILHDMAKLAGIKLNTVALDFKFSEDADALTGTVTTANDTYFIELDNLVGWFDPEVVDFMNDSIFSGEEVEGRIFDLPAIDGFTHYIFVPRGLYDKAIENGIIPEDPEYFKSVQDVS